MHATGLLPINFGKLLYRLLETLYVVVTEFRNFPRHANEPAVKENRVLQQSSINLVDLSTLYIYIYIYIYI